LHSPDEQETESGWNVMVAAGTVTALPVGTEA
jgi:hypothetical protein